ncbi:hypothetical protein [Rhodobacter xanthinilyticus]|nr:hypothetical protein [Rhodobacter xanthinilyticus]
MITMRVLRQFEEAAALGMAAEVLADRVVVTGKDIELPRDAGEPLRAHLDTCRYINKTFLADGWIVTPISNEPIKRLFGLVNGRLLPMAKPVERVDVRRKLLLTYDNCGFSLRAPLAQPVFDTDKAVFLGVTSTGVHVFEGDCVSDVKPPFYRTSTYAVTRNAVTVKGPRIGERSFVHAHGIKAFVDEIQIEGDSVALRGWAIASDSPRRKLMVALGHAGTVLMLPIRCTVPRPDIAMEFHTEGASQEFGFQIKRTIPGLGALSQEGLELVVLSEDGGDAIAAIRPVQRPRGLRRIVPKLI